MEIKFSFFCDNATLPYSSPFGSHFCVRCSQDDKPTSKKGLKKQQKEAEKMAKKAQRQAEVCINGVGNCFHDDSSCEVCIDACFDVPPTV